MNDQPLRVNTMGVARFMTHGNVGGKIWCAMRTKRPSTWPEAAKARKNHLARGCQTEKKSEPESKAKKAHFLTDVQE